MNRFLRNILLLALLVPGVVGCARHKTIPDDKLEQIFADIFLANAYVNQVMGQNRAIDTLDIYRPILKKYGYKVGDLTYTVENYSKRKSAKISTVVETSIRRLEQGEQIFTDLVAMRDTTGAVALRMFSDTVYYDTAIVVRSLADTAKLRIAIPVRAGDYMIRYYYFIDSLDRNGNSRTRYEMVNHKGGVTNTLTQGLSTRRQASISREMRAHDYDSLLVISLAGYGENMKRPSVRIDSIRVVYSPDQQAALDSMAQYYFSTILRYPDYAGLRTDAQDSGPLGVDPPWIPEGGDGNS